MFDFDEVGGSSSLGPSAGGDTATTTVHVTLIPRTAGRRTRHATVNIAAGNIDEHVAEASLTFPAAFSSVREALVRKGFLVDAVRVAGGATWATLATPCDAPEADALVRALAAPTLPQEEGRTSAPPPKLAARLVRLRVLSDRNDALPSTTTTTSTSTSTTSHRAAQLRAVRRFKKKSVSGVSDAKQRRTRRTQSLPPIEADAELAKARAEVAQARKEAATLAEANARFAREIEHKDRENKKLKHKLRQSLGGGFSDCEPDDDDDIDQDHPKGPSQSVLTAPQIEKEIQAAIERADAGDATAEADIERLCALMMTASDVF